MQGQQDALGQVRVRRAAVTVLPTACCGLRRAILCETKTGSGGLRKVQSNDTTCEVRGLKVRD